MNCAKCGAEPRDDDNYCRVCGHILNVVDSDITSAITRKFGTEYDHPPRCLIQFYISDLEWVQKEVNRHEFQPDEEARREVDFCSRLPTYSTFESIRFALEKAWQKRYEKVTYVRLDSQQRDKRILAKTKMAVESGDLHFTIASNYYGGNIHLDKDAMIQTLREILNELYDWGGKEIGLTFEFIIPFLHEEL